jgi:hypothetical protein
MHHWVNSTDRMMNIGGSVTIFPETNGARLGNRDWPRVLALVVICVAIAGGTSVLSGPIGEGKSQLPGYPRNWITVPAPNAHLVQILPAANGDAILLTQSEEAFSQEQAEIIRVSRFGEVKWRRTFASPKGERPIAVAEARNGIIVLLTTDSARAARIPTFGLRG